MDERTWMFWQKRTKQINSPVAKLHLGSSTREFFNISAFVVKDSNP